jgi:predicted dehydrogenase
MVVFDDAGGPEKIFIYDKGVDHNQNYETYGEFLSLRTGDILIPKISTGEPLVAECKQFLSSIESRKAPLSDGEEALKVLRILDAAQKSLEAGGAPVSLERHNEK